MTKLIGKMIAFALVGVIGLALAMQASGGGSTHPTTTTTTQGHTPVTICHKPGTPAEQTLVVDDDAVPGHLDHGDYLGECRTETTTTTTTEPDPCDTPAADQYEECNPPPTVTEPPPPRCPPGQSPVGGKDGDESDPNHNQECCYDVNANGVCDDKEQPPTVTTTPEPPVTTVTEPPVTTTVEPTTETETTEQPSQPNPVKPKPDKEPPVKQKPPKKHTPKPPPKLCDPGQVETAPCGVQGSG